MLELGVDVVFRSISGEASTCWARVGLSRLCEASWELTWVRGWGVGSGANRAQTPAVLLQICASY